MLTHAERVAALRAEVDRECLRRQVEATGRPFTDASRIERRAGRERAQEIETEARKHWRELERALAAGEAFVTRTTAEQNGSATDLGGFVTAQLGWIAPKIRGMITRAPYEVATNGEAAFDDRKPGRRSFIRDELDPVAITLGYDSPFYMPVNLLATFTLRAGFWPAETAEAGWAKKGYPTVAAIIALEIERVRREVALTKKKVSAPSAASKTRAKPTKRRA